MSSIRQSNQENNCAVPGFAPAAATGGTNDEGAEKLGQNSTIKVEATRETILLDDPTVLKGKRMMQDGLRMMHEGERLILGGMRLARQNQPEVERPLESEGRTADGGHQGSARATGIAATPSDGSLSLSVDTTDTSQTTSATTPTILKGDAHGRMGRKVGATLEDEFQRSLRLLATFDDTPKSGMNELDCSSGPHFSLGTAMDFGHASGRSHFHEEVSPAPSNAPIPFLHFIQDGGKDDRQASSPLSDFKNLSGESWTRQVLDESTGATGLSEASLFGSPWASAVGSPLTPATIPRQASDVDPSPPAFPSDPPKDFQGLTDTESTRGQSEFVLTPSTFVAKKRVLLGMTMEDHLASMEEMQRPATGAGQAPASTNASEHTTGAEFADAEPRQHKSEVVLVAPTAPQLEDPQQQSPGAARSG